MTWLEHSSQCFHSQLGDIEQIFPTVLHWYDGRFTGFVVPGRRFGHCTGHEFREVTAIAFQAEVSSTTARTSPRGPRLASPFQFSDLGSSPLSLMRGSGQATAQHHSSIPRPEGVRFTSKFVCFSTPTIIQGFYH